LLLNLLVASAFSLAVNVRTFTDDNVLDRHDRGLLIKRLFTDDVEPKSEPFLILSKRDRDYNQYVHDYPNNEIPDFVVCNAENGDNSQMYSQQDIWEAVNTGFAYLQNGAATSALPRFNARFYPHGFQGMDEGLQYTPTGAGNWNAAYEFPLAPRNGSPWNGGGYAPGPDRVVFDNNGIYMGVITHRGEINNAFQ